MKSNAAVKHIVLVVKQRRHDGILYFQQNLYLNFRHQELFLRSSDKIGEILELYDGRTHYLEGNMGPGGKE